ncbi:pilus assembly PilX N-terminal domain-containing protein [Motilimonas cestriensis]|uniref:Pilus assembly PilX N-terminal domain-containing protein n=1 Tax=Motilimonas cestriensis TaxID=2742685 RepID=A0ABS8W6T7_9GAMM|nr:pilus assembly PilX N-terminal domain-containing protein [Motilimonas cestriensis]MCE2594691.1 pilus assembly PilX N-terminal domain-containing protein [Motilimonas cestriensis]
MMKLKHRQNKQAGLAMLTVTLLLLISATSFTFFSVKSRLMEAKISSNDYRYRETFVNAEAGLEHAMSFLSSKDWQLSTPGLAGAANASGKTVYSLSKANTYDVEIIDECAGCGLVTVNSTGKGDSGLLTRQISRVAIFPPPLEGIKSPVVAAGSSMLTGSINIHAAPTTPIGLTAGDSAISAGGTQVVVDGSLQLNGKPIETHQTKLRGDNLIRYLGEPELDWQAYSNDSSKVIKITGCTNLATAVTQATLASNAEDWKTVWVEGDCVAAGSIGSETKPVRLVVQDGNVTGTLGSFYGLFYAFNTDATNPSRKRARFLFDINTNIHGAIIVDYKYTFSFNSSLTVTYRKDLLDRILDPLEGKNKAYWVPGGWNDFS